MIDKILNFKKDKFCKSIISILSGTLLGLPITACSTGKVYKPAQTAISVYEISIYDEHLIIKTLNDLLQLNIDSYHAYDQIGKVIKNKELKNFCDQMRADHEKHILELSKIINDSNAQPLVFSNEFKGLVTPGYTLIQGAKTQRRALEALQTNEIINNRIYNKALNIYMPPLMKEIIWKNAEDEKNHLQEVEKKLNEL